MNTVKYCSGCRNDRYNHCGTCERPGIDAPVTSKQCWSLKSAKLVTLYAIGTSVPMNIKSAYTKVKKPDCFHQNGTAFLTETQFRSHTS